LIGQPHPVAEMRHNGIGIDLEDPRRPSDAQSLGQAGDDVHDELGRGAFAMENPDPDSNAQKCRRCAGVLA
jgi:hypothetical protein